MKHTQGPWPIRISENEIDIIGPYKSNKNICTLSNSGEEDIANAHLIAAAPELLEALEELLEMADLYHHQLFGPDAVNITVKSGNTEHPINKSRSAIAKAKGL